MTCYNAWYSHLRHQYEDLTVIRCQSDDRIELDKSNGDYESTTAQKPYPDHYDKKRTFEFVSHD